MRKNILLLVVIILSSAGNLFSQDSVGYSRSQMRENAFVIWKGTKTIFTFEELASYCAPIFWYSPDEPELRLTSGKNIRIPTYFNFETPSDSPVVYYQIRKIIKKNNAKGTIVKKDYSDLNKSIIDISKVKGFEIDYNHYYRFEAGLGGHNHDTEQSQFKYFISKNSKNDTDYYAIIFIQATGKAHALSWYDNIFTVDTTSLETKLPFNILVEEGKHASCTDMNGDGMYTPGYDVNQRVNDAWGIRDVIRTGNLFSSTFESYMQKTRKPEHRVLPPLPDDSPHKRKFSINGIYSPKNAVYQLRPMPKPSKASPDKLLMHDMEAYSAKSWPIIVEEYNKMFDWFESGLFINSLGISYRYDDKNSGVSFTFPLLVVKNVEVPIIGGWLLNRIYIQDKKFRDFGYNLLITSSASGFLSSYFSAGLEVDKFESGKNESGDPVFEKKTDFTMETGIKLRANVTYSPLKFLSFLSNFWGVRLGIKNKGFPSIDHLNYTLEIGAGVW